MTMFRGSGKASSSIGRAPVSKTGGWGFEPLLACHPRSGPGPLRWRPGIGASGEGPLA